MEFIIGVGVGIAGTLMLQRFWPKVEADAVKVEAAVKADIAKKL